MEICDYQSGAMSNPKISVSEVKRQEDEHSGASQTSHMHQPQKGLKFTTAQAIIRIPGNTCIYLICKNCADMQNISLSPGQHGN